MLEYDFVPIGETDVLPEIDNRVDSECRPVPEWVFVKLPVFFTEPDEDTECFIVVEGLRELDWDIVGVTDLDELPETVMDPVELSKREELDVNDDEPDIDPDIDIDFEDL